MPACKRSKSLRLAEDSSPEQAEDEGNDMEIETSKPRKLTRAEKSKNAAKVRRDKELIEFNNIISCLPFPSEEVEKLDKSSVVKLTTSYLKMIEFIDKEMSSLTINDNKDMSVAKPVSNHVAKLPNGQGMSEGHLMLEALDGFLLLLDRKRRILFVSKNVEDHLGLSQVQMIGKPIENFIEEKDIPELRKQFNLKFLSQGQQVQPMDTDQIYHQLDEHRMFYIPMMCQYRNNKTRYKGHTLVQWTGRLKMRKTNKANNFATTGLVCVCKVMQTNSILEIKMDGNMFMSRHDLGMTFTFCDPRIITLIGYEPSEVIGRTAYQFHNPLDAERVRNCHSNLIVKGSSVSKYYRFIGKNSDWVWMQTRATIIYNTNNVPQYIVCMNYIISEEEGVRVLMEEDKESLSCTGVMDITSKPIKSREKGDNPDHHSDSGYHSGYSPYSSINPSPISESSFSHHDLGTDAADDFPMSVVQECASSLDPDAADSEEMMKFIASLDGNENESANNTQQPYSENMPWNGCTPLQRQRTLQRIQSCPQVSTQYSIEDADDQPIQFMCRSSGSNAMLGMGGQNEAEASQNCQVPKNGLVNIQIGSFNEGNLFSSTTMAESLPKEISDFCMQYAESMVDMQSQDIISQFAHDSLFPDLEGINPQVVRLGNQPVRCNNMGAPPNGLHSYAQPFTAPPTTLPNFSYQQTRPQTMVMTSPQTMVPTSPPMMVPTSPPMMVPTSPQMVGPTSSQQIPTSPPSALPQQYPTSPEYFARNSDTPNSFVSGTSVVSPQQSYSNLSSPMSIDTNISSPPNGYNIQSPQSQQPTAGMNNLTINSVRSQTQIFPNQPNLSGNSLGYNGQRVNGINGNMDRSLLTKINNSGNMSQANNGNRLLSNKMKTNGHRLCNGTSQPTVSSKMAPPQTCSPNRIQQSHSNKHSVSSKDIPSKGLRNVKSMSELEKMLRGYSPPFLQEKHKSVSAEGGSTLLQQMLTGKLSGEKYIEMEKQRQLHCAMRTQKN